MTIDREIRAAEAAALLANPTLTAAFDAVEIECVAQWDATGFANSVDRERAWMMRKAVQRIRGNLEALVTDGKIVARQIVQEPMR